MISASPTRGTRAALALSVLVLLAALAPAALADGPVVYFPESEVSLEAFRGVLSESADEVVIDEDGDLKVVAEDVKIFLKLDAEKKLIFVYAAWHLKESAMEIEKLTLVNRLNDQLLFVRFSMPNANTLFADYNISYRGGITGAQLEHTLEMFRAVFRGAALTQDPGDIIGTD